MRFRLKQLIIDHRSAVIALLAIIIYVIYIVHNIVYGTQISWSDWLWVLLGFFLIFLFMIIIFAIIFYLYYLFIKLKKKGYNSPFTYPLIALGLTVGIVVDIYFHIYLLSLGLILSLAMPFLTTTIIVHLLPKRNPRAYGTRKVRFPFAMIGRVFYAVSILLCIYIILTWIFFGGDWTQVFQLLVIAFLFPYALGEYCFYLAKRAEIPSIKHTLGGDDLPRSFVIYLRTFNQESDYFIVGPKRELGSYTSNKGLLDISNPSNNIGITFEQYFYKDLSTIGPFIALGSPEDYIPPEGASRMYANDKDWVEYFKDLSQRAACILIEVGRSKNLKWELEWLKKAGLQEKLFVITHPKEHINYIVRKYLSIIRKIKGVSITWIEFADVLLKIGYFLSPADPGLGSVLTFDKESQGILLATGAQAPSDFINAIQDWRLNGKYLRSWS